MVNKILVVTMKGMVAWAMFVMCVRGDDANDGARDGGVVVEDDAVEDSDNDDIKCEDGGWWWGSC